MDGDGRRAHQRYTVRLRVDCSSREAFLSSRVTNLSRGGVFIEGSHVPPVGTEVDLVLTLPGDEQALRVRGRVAWTCDMRKGSLRLVPGMGIRFLDLPVERQRQLAELLASLAPHSVAAPAPAAQA